MRTSAALTPHSREDSTEPPPFYMEEIDRWQTDENDIAPPSIFAHLLVGMIVGFLSAALALLVGFGFWGTLGAYSLGGVVGFSASTIVLMATHTQ